MGRLEQPPDKIATRCAQGLLTASQLKPRLGRNCSTFLLNSTEGMLRAQAGRQTYSFMRRVLLITLILNGTARASMNAETNIRGSQLARTPIETMPEELLADIGYGEVSTRRVTVLAGGSHRVKPEQKHVIIGKGRDRVGEDFDRGMKSTASIAFKRNAAAAAANSQEAGEGKPDSRAPGPAGPAVGDFDSIQLLKGNDDRPGDETSKEDEGTPQDDTPQDEGDSGENLMVIVAIVVGCGVLTLVILCIVRKIMDLCLMRFDPTGSISYSQEEGLPKATIERLPQTRYRKPPPKVQVKAARIGAKHDGPASVGAAAVTEGDVPSVGMTEAGEEGGSTNSVPVVTASAAAEAEESAADARDSTEDMCAICLIEYEHGDDLRIIPGCKHHFHKECIDPWLETKAVCAYCKATVEVRKSCCERVMRSASDRLGIRLVAPTTVRFSSSRRTYTNRDVHDAMGPSLPPSYGQSDVDYVGSMVGTMVDSHRGGNTADEETGEAPGGSAAGARLGVGSRSESATRIPSGRGGVAAGGEGQQDEPQGAIVVQPVAGSSFLVVPREFSSGAGGVGGGIGSRSSSVNMSMSSESMAAAAAAAAASRIGPASGMVVAEGGREGEEKGGGGGDPQARTASRTNVGAGRSRSRGRRGSSRGGSRRAGGGVRDGLGGVVFGGNTQEFKEAEAEDRARQEARAGTGPNNLREVTL